MEDQNHIENNNLFVQNSILINDEFNIFSIGSSQICITSSNSLCKKESWFGDTNYANEIPQTTLLENNVALNSSTNFPNSSQLKCVLNVETPMIGATWNVQVLQFDSKYFFYIQNTKHLDYINYIQTINSTLDSDEFSTISLTNIPKHNKTLVAAQDENGIWCRAKIKKKDESGLTVSFIDFGIDGVFVTDVKNLPTELKDIKPMAHRCCFNNLPKLDQKKLLDGDLFYIVSNYFSINEMTVVFLNNTEPYSVTLTHNGEDVLDIISKLAWDGIVPGIFDDPVDLAKYEMLNETLSGQQIECIHVGPIISIEHFYVETLHSNEISKNIRNEITSMTNWISLLTPKEGKIVIAKSIKDSKLYRARVLLYYEGREVCKCFLIDCGTFENCSEFFEPSKYLQTAPPVKIHCSLNLPKKYNLTLQESINFSFLDEITEYSNDTKILHTLKIGSPCIVDIEIKDLKISEVIKPREVRVIHALNVNSFKVRLNSNNAHKITNVLHSIKKMCKASNPKLHNIYVAYHANLYKRVRYMDYYDSSFEVKFVDEPPKTVLVKELFQLPKSIQNVQTTDIYCSLNCINYHYSTNKKFVDICDDGKTKFLMVIIKNDHIYGHIVKLFLNSQDVEKLILEKSV